MPAASNSGGGDLAHKPAVRATGDFASACIARQIGSAERRQMTVLFCDIVGSTALTTHHDPEDVSALLVRYRRRVAEIVTTHGGCVARYVGDGVLALWGYPCSDPDDGRLAVSAALAIVEDTSEGIEIRCALDTGIVVVGDIGASANGEPEIVGRAPNTAARLQHFAPANGVLVSEAVRINAGGAFDYCPFAIDAPLDAVPDGAWHVKSLRTGWRRSSMAPTALIGRTREQAVLAALWASHAPDQQHAATVLVLGEAGIGKSTLVADACNRNRREGADTIVVGCLPERRGNMLFPVRELLLALTQRLAPAAQSIQAKIAQIAQRTDRTDPADTTLLAAFLDVGCHGEPSAATRTVTGSPRDGHERLFDVLIDAVGAAARQCRLLLIVEDLQWAVVSQFEI